ncbi:hypothetical protein [Amphibacillus cookii]|uniref:hypothetical protein n=1 Tax=Amphibacillus cookii TaxID=767787 RepID=UPI0019586526|nr:hypothetical protein [Amphibacillus cookii]MBM7542704.1 hypothetical protein [Amphibacillus cookii]
MNSFKDHSHYDHQLNKIDIHWEEGRKKLIKQKMNARLDELEKNKKPIRLWFVTKNIVISVTLLTILFGSVYSLILQDRTYHFMQNSNEQQIHNTSGSSDDDYLSSSNDISEHSDWDQVSNIRGAEHLRNEIDLRLPNLLSDKKSNTDISSQNNLITTMTSYGKEADEIIVYQTKNNLSIEDYKKNIMAEVTNKEDLNKVDLQGHPTFIISQGEVIRAYIKTESYEFIIQGFNMEEEYIIKLVESINLSEL